MSTKSDSSHGFFARAWRWLKDEIVREVPPEHAVCEFDCRKDQCVYSEWATCEYRLANTEGDRVTQENPAHKPSNPA